MQTPWADRYAQRTQRMRSSAVRELLKLTEQPDVISFAGGLPAPETFPVERFAQAVQTVMTGLGAKALQYGTTEGYTPLRELIARHSTRYGINVEPENVLLTSGSQQALDLMGKVFINPGDHILVERPTYLGALQAWNAYQAEYVAADIDDEGYVDRVARVEDPVRTEVHLCAAELPEPERHHHVARAAEGPDRAGGPLRGAHPGGRPVRAAPVRGRARAAHRAPRLGVPVDRRRPLQRQRDLPQHVLEDPGAGHTPGLDHRAGGGHPEARAGQAGH